MLPDPISTGEENPPTEGVHTLGSTVPDFFQEDDEPALRSQVQWLEQHLGWLAAFRFGDPFVF